MDSLFTKLVHRINNDKLEPMLEKFVLMRCNATPVGGSVKGECYDGVGVELVVKEIDEDTGLTGVVDVYVGGIHAWEVKR